jgi:hypothetical protein
MPTESGGPSRPADDEFDRQLRALTGGAAGPAGFAEPSAAERARRAVRPARRRRESRQARKLREPLYLAGQAPPRPARRRWSAQRWSASWLAGLLRRYQSWLLVILILVALVATSIGLSWLSTH